MIVELNTCQFQLCQYRYFNLRTGHPIASCILSNYENLRFLTVTAFNMVIH